MLTVVYLALRTIGLNTHGHPSTLIKPNLFAKAYEVAVVATKAALKAINKKWKISYMLHRRQKSTIRPLVSNADRAPAAIIRVRPLLVMFGHIDVTLINPKNIFALDYG